VLEGASVLVDAFSVEFAIGLYRTNRVPTLTADELDRNPSQFLINFSAHESITSV